MINAVILGRRMAGWRKRAGLTQAELAERIGTKQPVISRVEAGRSLPKLPFLMRFAEATGQKQLVLNVTELRPLVSPEERRERVRQVLGDYVFNPWERDPTPAEAKSLNADGLTRELFDRAGTSSAG
jgi:transcriptional regulator with XRE-family HTH domain